ncbi:MAG: hypothetical protein IPO77_13635 [Acidobacteria bacterium]|nr:hypothetical protein [Acidobacteriota bacterium]
MDFAGSAQAKSRPKTPQAAVRTFFTQLKTRQYASLYEFLPSQLQQQITREQLAQNLKRLESFIESMRRWISLGFRKRASSLSSTRQFSEN